MSDQVETTSQRRAGLDPASIALLAAHMSLMPRKRGDGLRVKPAMTLGDSVFPIHKNQLKAISA